MLHIDYGVGYPTIDGSHSPLVNDIGRLTEIPPVKLGIVEVEDETNDVSLPVDLVMQ